MYRQMSLTTVADRHRHMDTYIHWVIVISSATAELNKN